MNSADLRREWIIVVMCGAPISSLELTMEVKQPTVEGKHMISDLSHQPLIPDYDITANALLGVLKI